MVYENVTIDWSQILQELVPAVIAKHSLSSKQLTGKKLWEKLKDIKMSEVGLSESIVEQYASSSVNNFGSPSSSTGPRKKIPELNRKSSIGEVYTPTSSSSSSKRNVTEERSSAPSNPTAVDLPTTDDDDPSIRKFRMKLNLYKEADENPKPLPPTPTNELKKVPSMTDMRRDIPRPPKTRTISEADATRPPNALGGMFKAQVEEKYQGQESIFGVDQNALKELQWEQHAEVLDMKEVLEDSPMTRQKIKMLETDIIEFATQLRKMIKRSKEACTLSQTLAKQNSKFADVLDKFRLSYDTKLKEDASLDVCVQKFEQLLNQVEEKRELLVSEVQIYLINPMDVFVNSDLKEVRELSKAFEKYSSQYEAISKQVTSKKSNQKAEAELFGSKNKMQVSGVKLAQKLNELSKKKKYYIMEVICAYMLRNLIFYESAAKIYKEAEDFVKRVYSALVLRRQDLDSSNYKSQIRRTSVQVMQNTQNMNSPQTGSGQKTLTKQGYIYKRKGHMHPVWKKRFFVINEGMLFEKKELNTVNCIPLLTCTVKQRPDIDKRCFEVVSPSENLVLQAETEDQMIEWKDILQKVIAAELNSQVVEDSNDKTPKDKPLTIIQKAAKENCECADCGAKGFNIYLFNHLDPEWASINLGLITCIECSGFHRALGVHISKVRSLNLDKWEPELLSLMEAVGNGKANKIWEFTVGPHYPKPNQKSSKDMRERWIWAKYHQKLFVNPVVPAESTKLMYNAAKKNDVITILSLLAQGVDIDCQNKAEKNKTSLHVAVQEKQMNTIVVLVLNRANVGAVDARGSNTFHYAATSGDTNIMNFLIKNCDQRELLEMEDLSGSTPMDIAVSSHNAEMVDLLFNFQPVSTTATKEPI